MKIGIFEDAFTFTLQHEGKTSMDPNDPGNWTGGKVGKGILKGTKHGISAASYPDLDIANLTLQDVRLIAFRDYWLPSGAGRFADKAPSLACRLFDLSFNCGVGTAAKMLQRAVNTVCLGEVLPSRRAKWRQAIATIMNGKPLLVDGKVGPLTTEVIRACPYPTALHAALRGEAYNHYKPLDPTYIPGWLVRLDTAI